MNEVHFGIRTTVRRMWAAKGVQPELTTSAGGKILLIHDNATWHRKAIRMMRESGGSENIRFMALPPYSPQLNPIERVRSEVRAKRAHNVYFPGLNSLREAVTGFFRMFEKPNGDMVRLCNKII
jgi:transposase